MACLWGYCGCHIEENFLDDKSNVFNWEQSRLRDPQALSRLGLVLVVATLYLTLQGAAIVAAQKRQQVDVHFYRGMSYSTFRLDGTP